MNRKIKITIAQSSLTDKKEENVSKALDMIEAAGKVESRIICFPEWISPPFT